MAPAITLQKKCSVIAPRATAVVFLSPYTGSRKRKSYLPAPGGAGALSHFPEKMRLFKKINTFFLS